MDDHSIFYSAVCDNIIKPVGLTKKLYDPKKLYLDYIGHHKMLIEALNKRWIQVQSAIRLAQRAWVINETPLRVF